MPRKWKKNVLEYGTIRYLAGSKTKVKVIGEYESKKPLCEVLETAPTSIFSVGDVKNIFRTTLFPLKGKKLYKR